MSFSPEKNPYRSTEGNVIDFSKKRLQFWMETVPPDIRRLEYDLYKRTRRNLNANIYRFDNKKKHGRFRIEPAFTEELDKADWKNFGESFLMGGDRKKRFSEIVDATQRDLPGLLEKNKEVIPENKIKLIALTGSSFYGPRRQGERLSDIDINFLVDEETDEFNFNVYPDVRAPSTDIPYHLLGTGYRDQARGEGRDIHWLLYPHFPIRNSLSDEELRTIIGRLVADTEARKDSIVESIKEIDLLLEKKSQEEIIG